MSFGTQQENKNYTQAKPYMKLVRDSVTGEPALKCGANQALYLPSPVCDDSDKNESALRYARYLRCAEYDNVPAVTLEALQGALNHQPNNYEEIPESMQYIIDDADGDGLSLDEHIKIAQAELLQMKFCGLLAEYSDLASLGVGDEQLTVQQVRELGLRSSIKIYPRDSIIAWDFKRVNGIKQLSWVALREVEAQQDKDSYASDEICSYLILALDENGEYYQKRYVEGESEGWEGPFYPEQPGKVKFKFIPFEFAIQGDYPKGVLPEALGYLLNICTKSLARYNVNAQMKEALWFSGAPVSWSSGWTNQAFETYKEMTGRDYISAGAGSHVPLPDGAQYGVMDWQAESSAFFTYLDRNAQEIKALGGAFEIDMQTQEQTATATIVNAAERLSVLSSLQSGLEKSYKRVIEYCALFTGSEVAVSIKLNREFMSVKLTPQERDAIRNDYLQGLIGRDEAMRQLEQGGILTKSAKDILNEIDMSGE